LKGVMLCLIGGVLGARVTSWLYWRHVGVRIGWYWPNSETLPLLRRLIGPMGIGYMLYGAIFLTMQTDSMIVGWLGGAGAAAEFILVWKAADILVQVIWRIPEYSQPYLIQLDARGEIERLRDGCQKALRWIVLVSVVIGICYALFGPWILRLWVGHENAIENPLAFFLAGGAIFWLGVARLPAVFAYATVRLKRLIKIVSIELIGKVILTFLFFPKIGYIAPLAAINVMHAAGIFLMYRRVIK
jgi:O-antigen/teichoic acid export membrane protein